MSKDAVHIHMVLIANILLWILKIGMPILVGIWTLGALPIYFFGNAELMELAEWIFGPIITGLPMMFATCSLLVHYG